MLAVHIALVILIASATSFPNDQQEDNAPESGISLAEEFLPHVPEHDQTVSYKGYQLVTVSPLTKRQRKAVIRLSGKQGVHFWLAQKNATGSFYAQMLLAPNAVPRTIRKLKEKGVEYKVAIRDLQGVIDEQGARPRDKAGQLAREGHPLTWDNYHRLEDIHAYLHYVAKKHPEKASVINAGKSYEGRDMTVLKLGLPSKHAKKSIWIDGGIHAREWISPAVVTYIARGLSEERDLLEKVDFYLMPVMNPDGYEYSQTKDRLWRKTRSPQTSGNETARRCYGVDANRNWDSHWGERVGVKDPCSHNYPGPSAFSEPETKAASDLLMKLRPDAYLTLHSYSQLWLLPWGHTAEAPEENARLRKVALSAVEAMQDVGGGQYMAGSIHNILYPISGSSLDWAHERAGCRIAYLVELRDTGEHGFVLPPREIEPTGREMLAAVMAIAREITSETAKARRHAH